MRKKTLTAGCAAAGVAIAAAGSGLVAPAGSHGGGLAPVQTGTQRVAFNHSFVNPLVEVFGDVRVGRNVFVAGNTVLNARPGARICLGDASNVQDNVQVHIIRGDAPRGSCARRSTSTDRRVSIAHGAEIVNSRIGRFTFIGFNSRLRNVVLEEGAFVLHGVTLRDVRIRRDRLVPVGATITTQAEADRLPRKAEAQAEFQREVLEVNREFAEGYADLYRREGFDAVTGVSRSPRTDFNPGRAPQIGAGAEIDPRARVVGDVRLGANVTIDERAAIRADEGSPIVVGADAEIENAVTFHALKGTSITIGDRLEAGSSTVFHGPLVAGNDLTAGDDAVVFRAVIGNGVTIGDGALVVGPADDPIELADGTQVPAGARITTQAEADALPRT